MREFAARGDGHVAPILENDVLPVECIDALGEGFDRLARRAATGAVDGDTFDACNIGGRDTDEAFACARA